MPGKLVRVSPSIRMGQMSVATGDGALRTLLGSCLGLALYDRRQRVGGLAHIVLPVARGAQDCPGKFVDTAIPELIRRMREVVRADLKLTAKIAGGASMFASSSARHIGQQNVDACERILADLGIPIVARHCGGTQGRRMSLFTGDGRVLIEVVGQETIDI